MVLSKMGCNLKLDKRGKLENLENLNKKLKITTDFDLYLELNKNKKKKKKKK